MTTRSELRAGQLVRLRVDTLNGGFGQVTKFNADGFSVTYEGHGRAKGAPRNTRHTYRWHQVGQFELGPFGGLSWSYVPGIATTALSKTPL
jgi:hypothetical protein